MRRILWGRRLVGVLAIAMLLQLVAVTVSFAAPDERTDDWCAGVVVHRGQTLSSIAYRYGVSWQSLAAYNGIHNPNYIRAGQCLSIPPRAYHSYYKPTYNYGYQHYSYKPTHSYGYYKPHYGSYGYCYWCSSYYGYQQPRGHWVWYHGSWVWRNW
jgi:hypothetical protein